jgi:acyl-CoA synthetase (AMP-forming)/AMP-acid ligase II
LSIKGRELPLGNREFVAKGPTIMTGYWNMPEETAKAMEGGVLHTRDLGYRDEEGYFYIVDRESETYRTGGENVYPAEVEKVLVLHPKIENVAIIGVPDEKWGETGKAFVVLKENESFTKEEMHQFLEGKVARYKYPTHLEFIKEIPLTTSGKIKKVDLKEREKNITVKSCGNEERNGARITKSQARLYPILLGPMRLISLGEMAAAVSSSGFSGCSSGWRGPVAEIGKPGLSRSIR